MPKRPLKQTSINAFFFPNVMQPEMAEEDDDDVVVQSTFKRGRAIIISDSEEEDEVPPETSHKRARANRLVVGDSAVEEEVPLLKNKRRRANGPVIPDSDEEEEDQLFITTAREISLEESLYSSDEEGHEEEEEDEANVVGATEGEGTTKTYAKGGNIWKRVFLDAAGHVTRVEFELQPRPTSVPSATSSVSTRTMKLFQEGIKGKKDILLHDWQKREQATFWRTWSSRTGWTGLDLRDKTQARRAVLSASVKVAEANRWLRAVVYSTS